MSRKNRGSRFEGMLEKPCPRRARLRLIQAKRRVPFGVIDLYGTVHDIAREQRSLAFRRDRNRHVADAVPRRRQETDAIADLRPLIRHLARDTRLDERNVT